MFHCIPEGAFLWLIPYFIPKMPYPAEARSSDMIEIPELQKYIPCYIPTKVTPNFLQEQFIVHS